VIARAAATEVSNPEILAQISRIAELNETWSKTAVIHLREGSPAVDRSRRPVVAARPGEDSGEQSVGQPPSVPRANIPMLLTVRHQDAQFVPIHFDPRRAVERASI
jgi:hypothetical protein